MHLLIGLIVLALSGRASAAETPTATPGPSPTPSPTATPAPGQPLLPDRSHVGAVQVEGNKHYSTAFIQKQFAPAIKDGTFDLKSFQRQLLLLNEFPGMNVKAYLKSDPQTGATDVVLKVKDDNPFSGALEYNNFGNPLIGGNHVALTLSEGNLTGGGDTLSGRAVTAFPSRNSNPYYEAQYVRPLNADGAKLGFYYSNGAFAASQELSLLDIRGRATVFGVNGAMPLERTLAATSDLTLGYVNKSATNLLLGQDSSHDELREIVSNYSRSWTSPGLANYFNFGMTNGLGTLFGGTVNGDLLASRQGAGDSFVKLASDYGRIIKMGDMFLVLRASAQWASGPLMVPEQYGLGGPDSVRGYQLAEILGDAGYAVTAEFRAPLGKADSDWQGCAFIDHGQSFLMKPLPGERANTSATGTGVGMRVRLFGQTYGRLDLGFPLEPAGNPSRSSPVLYGQMTTHF